MCFSFFNKWRLVKEFEDTLSVTNLFGTRSEDFLISLFVNQHGERKATATSFSGRTREVEPSFYKEHFENEKEQKS